MAKLFAGLTNRVTAALGSPWALILAAVVIAAWALTGPLFGFSDTWQLIINTATTIVTFLMVFVIQSSQNRSDKATHVKLDSILKWMEAVEPEEAIGAEDLSEDEIQRLRQEITDARRRRGSHSG